MTPDVGDILQHMKIAIFSDTHDDFPRIDTAIALAKERVTDRIMIHCGDVCAPVTLGYIAEQWSGEVHYCLGNVDGAPFVMRDRFGEDSHIHHHGQVAGELNIGGRSIAFQHYPKLARALAHTGDYDAVFYGHNHKQWQETVRHHNGDTLLCNPGNLCNILHEAGFGVYDTESNSVELLQLK